MATTHIWVSTDGDWSNTASWHDGVVPIATHTASFDDGSQSVTAGLNQSAVDTITVDVGPNYRGSFGSSGSPLQGGASWVVHFNGRNTAEAWFNLGDSFVFQVYGTSDNDNACVVDGGGSSADVDIMAARNVTLAAGLTLNNMRTYGAAAIATLKSGLTLTNAYIHGGLIQCYAALTNLYLRGGRWRHLDTNTHDITLVQQDGGTFDLLGRDTTISTLNLFRGMFDCTGDEGAKAISAGQVWPGGVFLGNKANTITAALTRRGGKIIGGSNITVTETVPELP